MHQCVKQHLTVAQASHSEGRLDSKSFSIITSFTPRFLRNLMFRLQPLPFLPQSAPSQVNRSAPAACNQSLSSPWFWHLHPEYITGSHVQMEQSIANTIVVQAFNKDRAVFRPYVYEQQFSPIRCQLPGRVRIWT